ncbi:MAG: hypothetical protein MZV70_22535 [Desulfobacterales bacterium]|nr:hypothetical protein [Desulfobacterales bacterium]
MRFVTVRPASRPRGGRHGGQHPPGGQPEPRPRVHHLSQVDPVRRRQSSHLRPEANRQPLLPLLLSAVFRLTGPGMRPAQALSLARGHALSSGCATSGPKALCGQARGAL